MHRRSPAPVIEVVVSELDRSALQDAAIQDAPQPRVAPELPAVERARSLLASGQRDPAPYQDLLAAHPEAKAAILALLHTTLGNAAVGEILAEPAMGARLIDTSDPTALDVPAAEAYNRAHIVDVVRFDRATHGQFARGDGQLDAARIAKWQTQHYLDGDGKVTENTCLVAEHKPALPPDTKPYDGHPGIRFLDDPSGRTFPDGYRIPLAVELSGPPGAAEVEVRDGTLEPRKVPVELGVDGKLPLDLPIDLEPGSLGNHEVTITARFGTLTFEAQAHFETVYTQLDRPDPQPLPPVRKPTPDRRAIDQAAAETYNREHVGEVVRFDRATKGYFAKPNGELDALAVAEWQTEHAAEGAVRSGKVDATTVQIAEVMHGGIDPFRNPDPATNPLDRGPDQAVTAYCEPVSRTAPIRTGERVQITVHARPDTAVELHWALAPGELPERGMRYGHTDLDGIALIEAPMNTMATFGPTPTPVRLQTVVSASYGTSAIQNSDVEFAPYSGTIGDSNASDDQAPGA